MKVLELKAVLLSLGLSRVGSKPDLKAHLLDAITNSAVARDADNTRIYSSPEDGFSNTVHWVELNPGSAPIMKPVPERFHAPTNQKALVKKHLFQFGEIFDRPVFQEKTCSRPG